MPNRGELPNPAIRAKSAAATPDNAWPVLAFCAIGFLISIYLAVYTLGITAAPSLIGQFTFMG
jgi:hypothetical protein